MNPKPRLDWADRSMFATLIKLLPTPLSAHRLVIAGTVLRWHKRLAARGWRGPPRHQGGRRSAKISWS
jgi:hypothetical protein